MAAFSSTDRSAYEHAALVRRSSSHFEGELEGAEQDNAEGSIFKQLQTLLEGPMGDLILEQLDYEAL